MFGIGLGSAVSTATVSVSQWLFAESYWALGFKIEKNISLTRNGDHLARVKRFGQVLVVLIITDSVLTFAFFICIFLV